MMSRSSRLAVTALMIMLFAGSLCADEQAGSRPTRPRIVAHRGAMTERPESTLSALRRAIELGADVVELDVRTSKDGVLFLLHDATLDRTTNGSGLASRLTIDELKKLDAGASFDEAYRGEKIPTLAEALEVCRGKIDVLLDLKEQGDSYAESVARVVQQHGDPARTIIGVRSPEQARVFRKWLPRSLQLGFIGSPNDIESYAAAGVDIIRLWPRWLHSGDGAVIVDRVRKAGVRLQLNGEKGTPQEILPILKYRPDWLLVNDPAALGATLTVAQQNAERFRLLWETVEVQSPPTVVPWIAEREAVTFLNRDYKMLELPEALRGRARLLFAGGEGDRLRVRFKKPTVLFAVFEYNTTGAWSFPEQHPPQDFGWQLVWKNGYRGTSNATLGGKPHYGNVYCREFEAGELLENLPPWWLCLAVVDRETAERIPGFAKAVAKATNAAPPFLYSRWATDERPLQVPEFTSRDQWSAWQKTMRAEFRRRLVFPYEQAPVIKKFGEPVMRTTYSRQEYHVLVGGRRVFRFFRLAPKGGGDSRLPTLVCFMGHGKVRQILDEPDSYQHACAARFAERGYLVFAMENVGMEPGRDSHHELDRLLRLDGLSWYSLLFAHQQILLNHVFADPLVDRERVGVTGVSTGGLLALSAIAMDPRVAAASVQGIFGSMRVSFIRDRNRHCACGAIPGLLPQFDLPEMALLASPRPLHISNAVQDGFRPEEAKRQIARIAPLYRRAGGREPRFTEPPGGHEFAFDAALAFFEDTIGKPHGDSKPTSSSSR